MICENKIWRYDPETRKKEMQRIADKLYELFKGMYNTYAFEGLKHWNDKKRDILNEIIHLTQEEAYCTAFCGVSPHEIRGTMKKINELIEKIVELELK